MASGAPLESEYFYVQLDPVSDTQVVQSKLIGILDNPNGMPPFDFVMDQMAKRFGRSPIDPIYLDRETGPRNLGEMYPRFPVIEVRGNEILDVMTALQFANRIAKVIEIH